MAATKRGSREKTITILLKTWSRVAPSLTDFRDRGLELLATVENQDRIAVHWGMSIAAYPFVASVAEVVGRLLRLQDQVSTAQMQRRIREVYGERETVARSARYVLRAFVDWGVVLESKDLGVYLAARQQITANHCLGIWLAEALLRAGRNGALPVRSIAGAWRSSRFN